MCFLCVHLTDIYPIAVVRVKYFDLYMYTTTFRYDPPPTISSVLIPASFQTGVTQTRSCSMSIGFTDPSLYL